MKKIYLCLDCKKPIEHRSTRCRSCDNRFRTGKIKMRPFTEEHKRKIGINNRDSNNYQWKGDDVGLHALHKWVKIRKVKSELCENCKQVPPVDLANISGKYKRDIKDFKWLCRACHMKEDGRMNKLKEYNLIRKRLQKGDKLLCTQCKIFKGKKEFNKNKQTPDGYFYICKICSNKNRKIIRSKK